MMQKKKKINDGDICRVFNNLGETFAYALIVKDLLPGTINVPKQIRSSQLINESNINSLVSEEVADFGKGPIYYSTFAEVEKHLKPRKVLFLWEKWFILVDYYFIFRN